MDKKKFLIIALSIVAIIVLGAVFVVKITSATPEKLTGDEMNEVLTLLSSSTWSVENDKRNKRIEELSFSNIISVEFGIKEKEYLPIIINTADNLGFEAKVVKGETGLKLIAPGAVLDIWYSENSDGSIKNLTLRGDKNYLVFTLK